MKIFPKEQVTHKCDECGKNSKKYAGHVPQQPHPWGWLWNTTVERHLGQVMEAGKAYKSCVGIN